MEGEASLERLIVVSRLCLESIGFCGEAAGGCSSPSWSFAPQENKAGAAQGFGAQGKLDQAPWQAWKTKGMLILRRQGRLKEPLLTRVTPRAAGKAAAGGDRDNPSGNQGQIEELQLISAQECSS